MSYAHSERLSGMDASFLALEDANCHMHIASVALFDAGPLTRDGGGIDFPRILEAAQWALRGSVRLRQKLASVPALGHPVWVDDERFNLAYHVRHAALPAPGDIRQLKRLAGRLLSQQLDRGKPLWETWYVEGVAGNRFAVITKIHHCMADGLAGAGLFAAMMGPDPHHRPGEPAPWVPRPAPGGARLLAGELSRRARLPLALVRAGRRLASGGDSLGMARAAARSLGRSLSLGLRSASSTPLNADLGPHRRIDWTGCELEALKEVYRRCGGKLNDVVLTVVAGAVRRFLRGRGLDLAGVDFRAIVPVNVRDGSRDGSLGNRVSQVMASLPVDEPDPLRRHARVVEMTGELKRTQQHLGTELVSELADWVGAALLAEIARIGLRTRAANVIVTNVPGPTQPIHLLGARMLEVYPAVPLALGQTLGIALFSYAGGLYWGFNADWDALPDLHDLVDAVDREIETLRKAAVDRPPELGGPPAP